MTGIRVLICEDEGLTTLRLRASLTRAGYEVVGTARNGEEGVSRAAELCPDLVLMDVEMPRLDGISAARAIMAARPTAVVILSAYSERGIVGAALEAGIAGYLVKPVADEQLIETVADALAAFRARGSC